MLLPPLTEGRLLRRYQRFLADVELADGTTVTAHCPNTGSMQGCKDPGSRVWLSASDNPKRKLPWTWEIVEADGVLVGLHTGRTNGLVREAIEAGAVPQLAGYERLRGEVPYGGPDGRRSRIDLLLEADDRPPCYVEVKNVTAAVAGGLGFFPDAVTERGTKHLREMAEEVARGHRAVLFFCVQRDDVREVRPADHIDPEYGRTLRQVLAAGVEVLAYGAEVLPSGIRLLHPLPVVCPD
ncbi:sugar fermentation stimulation protein homolog [Azospira sp. I13]|uniref:DNA/RNA nuclease SfsA n=1 Tax=Azospira sp. I13 TaxID=1765050 RepID=UPI000D493C9E|nr:DNA/RNA nuclease SfsA [Azospira sp. I13]GBG02613.1 sugar fermentation stimulation protein homolog [Azospira sp. I13]